MKTKRYTFTLILGFILSFATALAQPTYPANLQAEGKAPTIMLSYDNLIAGYLDSLITVELVSGVDFTVTSKADWIRVDKFEKNYLYLTTSQNESDTERTGVVEIADVGSSYKKLFTVTQLKNNAESFIKGDHKIKVSSATASASQPGEGINLSHDGNMSTHYHSPWSGNHLPVTLTYNFQNVDKIDYLIYHPRTAGGSNGNFEKVKVYYQLEGSNSFVLHGDYDFGGSSASSVVVFPDGLENPTAVRFVVSTGVGGFASCAEMEFYQINPGATAMFELFEDKLCTVLKPEVTEEQINALVNPFAKKLARTLKAGGYNTEFRVNEFEAYPTISETANWMKTSGYNPYENPTGIYFEKDDEIIIFVDNPGEESVSLLIENQYPTESGRSTYFLKNGINKIKAANRGQSYLSYYTTNWATAPKVKVHFAFGKVTGYYDLEKYKQSDGTYDLATANSEFTRLIGAAKEPMFDVISQRHHACYPTQGFKTRNVGKGANFALAYDSIVYREHELMGLIKYKKEPKNRMYSRSVASGMFADGTGAGIPNMTSFSYIEARNIDWWGIAHELGHVNQVRPNLKWVSTTEVTNNIYSSYVQHKIGNGPWIRSLGGTPFYRLEDEDFNHSVDYMHGVGGRFNAYLNHAIKDGVKWMMQEGHDYYYDSPSGSPAGKNYDHFVKLAPLWQLTLYFHEAGYHPDFWGEMHEAARQDPTNLSDGQYQLNFMKHAMDSTGMNLVPFFEKVGMLKVYNDYLIDYTNGYMRITQAQVDALKVHGVQYPEPESPVMYYISAKNYEIYRDQLPLEVEYQSEGLVRLHRYFPNNGHVGFGAGVIQNAVAFETFDANGKLTRITMAGFRYSSAGTIFALYPAGSARIDAIGWDGTRKTVYNIPN